MQIVKVKIINKSKNDLPKYTTIGSAGMDIRANIEAPIDIPPMNRRLIPTGLYIQLPLGYEAQVRPRSGLALKQGLTVLNTPGTIDSDYRGEIGVILINLSNEVQSINPGDRIAQIVIAKHEIAELIETDILDETERGEGGFGHSGKS